MVDSHTHLFLCERPEADSSRRRGRPGLGGCSTSASGSETNAGAIAAAERHEGVFATRRPPPDLGGRVRRRPRRRGLATRGSREGARDRGDGDRLLPRDRGARPTSAGPSRRRSRSPASASCRSSSMPATPTARRRRPTRSSRSSTRERAACRYPALLSRSLAGGGRDRARLVLLLLGHRHLPQVRRPARGGGEAARRAGPGRDRRSLPGAATGAGQAATSRPTSSRRPRRSPRCGASPTRSWSGSWRRTRRPSSAGSAVGPARPELPRRSEPARRDRPRRRSRARGRGAGGRGGGGGADRAAGGGRGARPRGRDRSRAGAGPCPRRRPGQRQPALGRRDEARLRRAATRRRRRSSPTSPTRSRRRCCCARSSSCRRFGAGR